jgi:hypothetical protein
MGDRQAVAMAFGQIYTVFKHRDMKTTLPSVYELFLFMYVLGPQYYS